MASEANKWDFGEDERRLVRAENAVERLLDIELRVLLVSNVGAQSLLSTKIYIAFSV